MVRLLQRLGWPRVSVMVVAFCATVIVVAVILARCTGASPNRGFASVSNPPSGVEAYRGLGTWVDLYDTRAWRDPKAAVRDMASHGVHTLFIETATARSSSAFVNPSALRTFLSEAHKRRIYVVGWYAPDMRPGSVDYDRVLQAIEMTTKDGQRFDSVALDIESTAVKSVSKRNSGLAALSRQIRDKVGPSYPLGGIIPSPVGLKKEAGFWDVFPYTALAKYYDVLMPMGYYTFHGRGAAAAKADARANMRILRAQPGCSNIPVHLIGGLATDSSAAEVGQFATAARDSGCIGASLYDWIGMDSAKWRELSAVWPRSGK